MRQIFNMHILILSGLRQKDHIEIYTCCPLEGHILDKTNLYAGHRIFDLDNLCRWSLFIKALFTQECCKTDTISLCIHISLVIIYQTPKTPVFSEGYKLCSIAGKWKFYRIY